MRHIAIAVALTLVGCAAPQGPPARGEPVVRHAPLGRLVDEPAHDPPSTVDVPQRGATAGGAAQVATQLIADGLDAQGLDVVDLGVQQTSPSDGAAAVVIAATHESSGGITHTSIYLLHLVRTSRGWALESFRQVQ